MFCQNWAEKRESRMWDLSKQIRHNLLWLLFPIPFFRFLGLSFTLSLSLIHTQHTPSLSFTHTHNILSHTHTLFLSRSHARKGSPTHTEQKKHAWCTWYIFFWTCGLMCVFSVWYFFIPITATSLGNKRELFRYLDEVSFPRLWSALQTTGGWDCQPTATYVRS